MGGNTSLRSVWACHLGAIREATKAAGTGDEREEPGKARPRDREDPGAAGVVPAAGWARQAVTMTSRFTCRNACASRMCNSSRPFTFSIE